MGRGQPNVDTNEQGTQLRKRSGGEGGGLRIADFRLIKEHDKRVYIADFRNMGEWYKILNTVE